MSYEYSDDRRANDPHALPDVEVFEHRHTAAESCELLEPCDDEVECAGAGWYWQSCFPGCLPDGEAFGPFLTREEALADAREGIGD